MRSMRLALLAPAILLSSCVIHVNESADSESGWQSRQRHNQDAINHMVLGRSRASIEADLGNPDFTDAFQRNGSTFVVLYYRTRHMHDDGETTRDETTPLVFVDGRLVGWGPAAINHATAK